MTCLRWHQIGKKTCAPQNVTRKMTSMFGLDHYPSANSTAQRKSLNTKAMITYKRPTAIGPKLKSYNHLAIRQKKNRRCVRALASTVHFMFAMENNKSIVPNPNCFINTDKNITFLWNQSLACANYGIYVATCVISHQEYIGLTINKFSNRRSAHQGTWNKSDNGDGSDQIGLSRHYSLFHGIINKHLPRPPRSGRA